MHETPTNPIRFLFVVAGFLLLIVRADASTAYLRTVGPSPMRFEAAQMRVANLTILPPLSMGNGIETNSTHIQRLEVTANTATTNATNYSFAMTALPEPIPFVSDVTPQLLLPYFEAGVGSGSNRQTTVVAPIAFTPPRAGAPPSSTANYFKP